MIHLCVVNHCGEKATFYLSEPNPDHMATLSPAHFSSSPPLFLSALLLLRFSPWTSPPFPSSFLLLHPQFICSPPSRLDFLLRKLPPCLLPLADFWKAKVCMCVCVCCRSMGTGLFSCQLQSALTCASNVVYCPNTSLEEHLRRPLKFKAIYHYLPPPPLDVSHHPSLPPPLLPMHAVTISSFSSPPSSLTPLSPSITSIQLFPLLPEFKFK